MRKSVFFRGMKRQVALFLSFILIAASLNMTALPLQLVKADEGGVTQIFAPEDLAIQAGSDASFALTIQSGTAPYTYRWQTATSENGPWQDVSGGSGTTSEMTFSVTLTAVTIDMSGTFYRCVVTDSATPTPQSLTSSVARLQVTAAGAVTATPTATPGNNTTVGINQGIRLAANIAWNRDPQIRYTAGFGPAADVPAPTLSSTPFEMAIRIPSEMPDGSAIPDGTQYVIKAIAASNVAATSPVATFTYTIDTVNARLTDIKSEEAFITWKENNFKGATPQVVKDKIDQVVARMATNEKIAMTLGRSLSTTGIDGISNATLLPGDASSTVGFVKYGITSTSLSDGPAGIRITVGEGTTTYQRNATAWPNGTARGATWNNELIEKMGDAWGQEIAYFGGDLILAPGMNIHRSVLGGRNFEYYSEDPLHSGLTAAHETIGIQKNNIGVNAKHYAVNNQESGRHGGINHVADTRALREIYLRNFEYLMEVGKPWSLMGSYNRINGVAAMQSHDLNNQIPRNEWGFDGFIVTDWNELGEYTDRRAYPQLADTDTRTSLGYNTNYTANSGPDQVTRLQAGPLILAAGEDLIMPGNNGGNQVNEITNALNNPAHPLTMQILERAVKRVLEYVVRSSQFNDRVAAWGAMPQKLKDDNRVVGREIGAESIILLKNEIVNGKPSLPLSKNPSGSVLSLGMQAGKMTMQTVSAARLSPGGGGSGIVQYSNADLAAVPSLNEAMKAELADPNKLIETSEMSFTQVNSVPQPGGFSQTLNPAKTEMVVPDERFQEWAEQDISAITFVITRGSGEGADIALGANPPVSGQRGGYYISGAEQDLIDQASALAKELKVPFIVVLNMGNWVRMSDWEDKADAIIMAWQQGMGGGTPAAQVLFGTVNPSGKAPTSVPIDLYGDAENGALLNPSEGQFAYESNPDRTPGTAHNRYTTNFFYEGIYLGYRYYDTFNVPVSVPFGHGLSYTTFEYGNVTLSKNTFNNKDDRLTASVTIKNTGAVAGKEVVQLYVGAPGVQMPKPVKELKGYEKTRLLAPGESQTITFELDAKALASYSNDGPTDGQWLVEAGPYAVYFASSSQDIRDTRTFFVPAGFTTHTVDAGALSPIGSSDQDRQNAENLETNAIRPEQITVTFEQPGGANFKKAYSVMGSTYGYLPELPEGYIWLDKDTGKEIAVSDEVTDGDKTFSATPAFVPEIYGHSLTLDGTIGVNWYVSLPEAYQNDSTKMKFTYNNKTTTVAFDADEYQKFDGKTLYRFTYSVPAKEMTQEIKAQLVGADDAPLLEEDSYTVKTYADVMLTEPSYSETAKAFATALLNYGGYAQTYFKYNTDNLANADINKTLPAVPDLSGYATSYGGNLAANAATWYGSSLVLESQTVIRHYVTITNAATAKGAYMKYNGKQIPLTLSTGNIYYADINNISARDLSTTFEAEFCNASGEALCKTKIYGPYTYVNNQLNSTNADLQNIVKALYGYGQAAKNYLNEL